MNDTGKDTVSEKEATLRFVQANWPQIGAIAFKHSLLDGRGAVVVRLQKTKRIAGSEYKARAAVRYVTGDELARLAAEDRETLVINYDPASQAVIVTQTADGGYEAWLYSPTQAGRPTPQYCYLAMTGAGATLANLRNQ